MGPPLKLRAVDQEDLEVLSACLQDALVPVQDMRFLKDERRFVMVANRFCWENLGGTAEQDDTREGTADDAPDNAPDNAQEGTQTAKAGAFERVHCGITFEHVSHVQARGFSPGAAADQGRLLEVLAILVEDGALTVVFSGGAAVKLEVDKVEAFVQDMGEPWPTLWRPRHPMDDELDRDGGTR
ncbi:MAG: DUF2948 family protein [Alphaproteobacteria bacterium]|nr:DUF2948 family protein [Alphaproteobacteria bacterium]